MQKHIKRVSFDTSKQHYICMADRRGEMAGSGRGGVKHFWSHVLYVGGLSQRIGQDKYAVYSDT